MSSVHALVTYALAAPEPARARLRAELEALGWFFRRGLVPLPEGTCWTTFVPPVNEVAARATVERQLAAAFGQVQRAHGLHLRPERIVVLVFRAPPAEFLSA